MAKCNQLTRLPFKGLITITHEMKKVMSLYRVT